MIIGCEYSDGTKQYCVHCLLDDEEKSCFDFRKSVDAEVTKPIYN